MKLTKEEVQTVKTYDTNAHDWVSKHASARFWGIEMDRFKEFLPKGKVLEIGSGGGRDAKELIANGYEYTGTDISQGLLEEAKKLNPGAVFLHQSVYDLDFSDNFFDGFWASAVLLHIPRDRINEALGRLHGVTRSGGVGFITIKQGEGQRVEEDDPGMAEKRTRLFTYWQDENFQKVLKKNGFDVVESSVKPINVRTTWLIFFVKVIK